jgi:hypothetical protein
MEVSLSDRFAMRPPISFCGGGESRASLAGNWCRRIAWCCHNPPGNARLLGRLDLRSLCKVTEGLDSIDQATANCLSQDCELEPSDAAVP